jgi:hypothetical protein
MVAQQEWEKKLSDLKDEMGDIKREKSDVRKLVDSDIVALKEKEDELVQSISMLEKDRERLINEEKSLIAKLREFEKGKREMETQEQRLKKQQSVLEEQEKKIADNERIMNKGMLFLEQEKLKLEKMKDEVYRSKKLRQVLPQLEKRYNQLTSQLHKAEARLIDATIKPSKARMVKELERELEDKQKGLEKGFSRLLVRENEVRDLEERREKAFENYLRKEAKTEESPKQLVHPEIHSMIDEAREKLMRGDIDTAVRMVAEAELLVERVESAELRRMLMYDIKDLKASIKLASLS